VWSWLNYDQKDRAACQRIRASSEPGSGHASVLGKENTMPEPTVELFSKKTYTNRFAP